MKTIKAYRKMRVCLDRAWRPGKSVVAFLLLVAILSPLSLAQDLNSQSAPPAKNSFEEIFRLERVSVADGAELITILARFDGVPTANAEKWVPLVTVLRDTLGDRSQENDRLRYVWPLTYTRPTARQRLLGAIPFLYSRVGNKQHAEKSPPPVLDLAAPDRDVWNQIFWSALQTLLLDPYGIPIKASTRTYRQNASDYRKSHVIRALSVLSLYQAVEGVPAFSESELSEIQARLRLTDKSFGGLVSDLNLQRYNDQQVTAIRDTRGHNWELLRQRAEAESLFFEPLEMPDGSMTHAMLWVSKSDLARNQGKPYDGRFLNISNPWSDKRLSEWNGYSETRFFDSENRSVSPETPRARETELVPLALYGLDNPKIPMLLVDFRDGFNPKKREMSHRALQDVTRNILSVSRFGDLPYFVGRSVLDFVTGRRGIDINQPSRLRTYSQLKLLLSLNQSLDPEVREQIGGRLERVSLNPFENDLDAEAKLATEQYAALLDYASRPDGLPRKLDRDRRAEMVALKHGQTAKAVFRLANILSFGQYTHREPADPAMAARLDVSRRLAYHTHFLQQIAESSPQIDVTWNMSEVNHSLEYIAEHATSASAKSAVAAANIFTRTQDSETRRFCLESLSRMTTPKAKTELQRLSQRKDLDRAGRDLVISYLTSPPQPAVTMTISGEKSSGARVDQQ